MIPVCEVHGPNEYNPACDDCRRVGAAFARIREVLLEQLEKEDAAS